MKYQLRSQQPRVSRLLAGLSFGLLLISAWGNFARAAEAGSIALVGKAQTLTPLPEVNAKVEANEQEFLKAVLAQDNAALTTLLHPDFVYVHENGLLSTRAQFLKDYVAKGYTAAVSKPKEPVRQYGSTIFTISTGHLQLKGESPYPPQTVTHIWAEQGGKWLLVHRHESHRGEPIGKALPQSGGPNLTAELGSKPAPELQKLINEREASWVYCMLASDDKRMEELLDDTLRYVHDTAHTSTKSNFMSELRAGYTVTYFLQPTYRQFGDTVIVLHQGRYRHTGRPEQSVVEVYHAWAKRDGRWVLVGRHSTQFEPH